jgi:isochorismate hydrolase
MSESTFRSPELLSAGSSRLLIVDMQQKFMPSIKDHQPLVDNCIKLIKAAGILQVPVCATEQYPQGLGPTIPELSSLLPAPVGKVRFSCCPSLEWASDPGRSAGRHQIVVAGIEAHVCVLQTAFDLLCAGFDVFIVADAVRSRSEMDAATALRRLADGGSRIITTEMALFEWCEAAGSPEFKEISRLITGR